MTDVWTKGTVRTEMGVDRKKEGEQEGVTHHRTNKKHDVREGNAYARSPSSLSLSIDF